jgi:hypothetical protein
VEDVEVKTVTIQNYDRAQSDYIFYETLNYTGNPGKIGFLKTLTPVTSNVQNVVRMNRDTLYGYGVFDLNCPVTIELPPNEGRYLSLYGLDNDQYSLAILHSTKSHSASIRFSFSKANQTKCSSSKNNSERKKSSEPKVKHVVSDTRYIYVIIRVFVDPNNKTDILVANRIQEAITVTQGDAGKWSWPNWNTTSLLEVQEAFEGIEQYLSPDTQINGYRNEINPTAHLIACATSWGGNPPKEAVYKLVSPPSLSNLSQVYYIQIDSPSDIPINPTGFWSVTVYNENDYLEYNNASAYSVNGVTAQPESDGSIRIYFSNTIGDGMKNWLYIFPGWNYVIRLYLPEESILNNTWSFPALQQL